MADLTELTKCGKELGLGGEELRAFVEGERDRAEKLERDKCDQERERRAYERDMRRMELEILEKQAAVQNESLQTASNVRNVVEFRPKLPPFDDQKDQLDSYIERFERYADTQKWKSEDRAVYLGALLTGKALDVYVRLSNEEASDYELLKVALYKRFRLTADGFRKKFTTSKPESNETVSQYAFRLGTYLDRWVEMSDVEMNFEGLRQLVLKEQFLLHMPRDLGVFIREREPKTISDAVKLADTYMEARCWTRLQPNRANNVPSKGSSNQNDIAPNVGNRTASGSKTTHGTITCYRCHEVGHVARNCKKRARETIDSKSTLAGFCKLEPVKCEHNCSVRNGAATLECGCHIPVLSSSCQDQGIDLSSLPVAEGLVGETEVSVMRDTGCSGVVVRRSLVDDGQLTGEDKRYVMIDRTVCVAPVALISVNTPFFTGQVEAICMPDPICDLVIGNVQGARLSAQDVTECRRDVDSDASGNAVSDVLGAVQTRSQSVKDDAVRSLNVPRIEIPNLTRVEIKTKQQEDKTLKRFHLRAERGDSMKSVGQGTEKFVYKAGILYRLYVRCNGAIEVKQLVVPAELRPVVLRLGHDSVMAGHLGVRKTLDRILSNFYWPGVTSDVDRFCKSCDICQKTISKGRVPKVPVQEMPLIDTPFRRVAADIVGPIQPRTDRKNKYILTVVDYATRYPEAVALPEISSETVAEALWSIFSRVGIPQEILTDNGSNFTSAMMAEFCRLLSIDQLRTTPYHAMCNGLVEKFNGTLKNMLKKLCAERPADWDRYLEPLLFAYREVPQESLRFSPFELLYGRTVRGPMVILRELWTKECDDDVVRTTYEYVVDLRNRLEDVAQLAHDSLTASQSRYKRNYDRKAVKRTLGVGDQVLVLLPSHSNKLLMHWKGPYEVKQKVGLNDYRIDVENKQKLFHINMLKRYVRRDDTCAAGLIAAIDTSVTQAEECGNDLLQDYPSNVTETIANVNISEELTKEQADDVRALLREYSDIFSNIPGVTDLVQHDIVLTTDEPITVKPYPVPHSLHDTVNNEVREMSRLGIIEPSNSPYRSPLLLVRKKDATYRPVIDFRVLNRVTIFDAEPMPNAEEIFARVSKSRFLTKLDFCKGYWQIPLSENAKDLTSFYTPFGLHRFTKMPFGLKNSGSSYNRMIRKLLDGMSDVDCFVDDLLIHTESWEVHVERMREVFERVRRAHLTVKPSKCYFGYSRLEYVGHMLGQGAIGTLSEKVERVRQAPRPETKKELRSFLGLAGYYQRYIPNYSSIAAPLTDLTKKGNPNKLDWKPVHELAFQTLKDRLCTAPVLRLPDFGTLYRSHDPRYRSHKNDNTTLDEPIPSKEFCVVPTNWLTEAPNPHSPTLLQAAGILFPYEDEEDALIEYDWNRLGELQQNDALNINSAPKRLKRQKGFVTKTKDFPKCLKRQIGFVGKIEQRQYLKSKTEMVTTNYESTPTQQHGGLRRQTGFVMRYQEDKSQKER